MKILNEYIDDLKEQLNFVNDKSLKKKIHQTLKELKSITEDSSNGSKAIKDIVQNLKNFSRLDEAKWKEAKISEIFDSCLKMVKPQISDQLKIEIDLKDDPIFFCNPGQLNQVLLNLLTNAYQAINGPGLIKIESNIRKNVNRQSN